MRIAISTLGQSWLILPEVLGFLDPSRFDFYEHHSEASRIHQLRQEHRINGIDELWVFLTTDPISKECFTKVKSWANSLPNPPCIRGWSCKGVEDIGTEQECRWIRNILFLLVLHGHRRLLETGIHDPSNSALYVSLTGGRKTISGDLQDAASYFGCSLLFHIIDRNSTKHPELRSLGWETLKEPLEESLVNTFLPIPVGSHPFLDPVILEGDFFSSVDFQIPEPEATANEPLELDHSTKLIDFIEKKTKRAFYFYENLLSRCQEAIQNRRNFLTLFTLPPRHIDRLRNTKILGTEGEASPVCKFLKNLPKAELHCHLGGVLSVAEAVGVASSWREEVKDWYRSNQSFKDWAHTVKQEVKNRNIHALSEMFKEHMHTIPRHIQNAEFLLSLQDSPELLERVVYGELFDPALCKGIGFSRYEGLGDFQGSSLLQSEETIRLAVKIATQKAEAENVQYMEIRCSPLNYTRGTIQNGLEVYRIIAEELSQAEKQASISRSKPIRYRILLIASRHRKLSQVHQYIELMEEIFDSGTYPEMLAGIDLAGDEKKMPPAQLREAFEPVMEHCQHITIHAGEEEKVDSIWQAVYYLHAERIGHGLTLKDNPDLMRKFIERGIALELCPSSNEQIVGDSIGEYPLLYYLEEGVPVTVNTDNPGISRTNLTQEYLTAARLTKGGLSILQILQIVKNGFSAAFLPLPEREKLLLSVEKEIYENLSSLLEEV